MDLSKSVKYDFWYDYVKPKYSENTKLSYIDANSFIVHVKADNIYKKIEEDVETRSDTSNYELEKEGKVIGLMKDKLGVKTVEKIVRVSAKP